MILDNGNGKARDTDPGQDRSDPSREQVGSPKEAYAIGATITFRDEVNEAPEAHHRLAGGRIPRGYVAADGTRWFNAAITITLLDAASFSPRA